MMSDLRLEILKMGVQLLGAGILARLTVYWALSRTKTEKTWERRLGAFGDAVSALSEMRRIVGLWIDEEMQKRGFSDERKRSLTDRYHAAKRQLEEASAISQLILPDATSATLTKLLNDIESINHDGSWFDFLQQEDVLLGEALKAVISQGRSEIGSELRVS